MTRILTTSSFEVYHRDLQQEFVLRRISEIEDISKWIDMVSHSNIVTALEQFKWQGEKFQLVEKNNGGNMYQKI